MQLDDSSLQLVQELMASPLWVKLQEQMRRDSEYRSAAYQASFWIRSFSTTTLTEDQLSSQMLAAVAHHQTRLRRREQWLPVGLAYWKRYSSMTYRRLSRSVTPLRSLS